LIVRAALLCPAQHQPGRGARRQHAPGRRDQHRPGLLGRLASQHDPLRCAQALKVARQRGVAAPVAVLLQDAEQLAAVTAATVPVLEHDVLPGIKQAVPGVGTTLALGKGLAVQVAEHGRAADAEVAGDRLP